MSKRLKNDRGMALLESGLVLMVLIPLGIASVGVWDFMNTSTVVSDMVNEAVYSIETNPLKMVPDSSNGFKTEVNPDLEKEVDAMVARTTSELTTRFADKFESYVVKAVIAEGDLSGSVPFKITKETKLDFGQVTYEEPFRDGASRNLKRAILADHTVSDKGLGQKAVAVGLMIVYKPKESFFTSVLNSLGGNWVVNANRVLDLRGEYAW